MSSEGAPSSPPQGGESVPNVRWDDSNMRSLYANVVNVTGTREEVILLFGIHQAWQSGAKEVVVQLLERIILNPHAAKRLNVLLSHMIREYESRYGQLTITSGGQPVVTENLPTRP